MHVSGALLLVFSIVFTALNATPSIALRMQWLENVCGQSYILWGINKKITDIVPKYSGKNKN